MQYKATCTASSRHVHVHAQTRIHTHRHTHIGQNLWLRLFVYLQGPPGRAGLPGADGIPGPPGTVLMLPVRPQRTRVHCDTLWTHKRGEGSTGMTTRGGCMIELRVRQGTDSAVSNPPVPVPRWFPEGSCGDAPGGPGAGDPAADSGTHSIIHRYVWPRKCMLELFVDLKKKKTTSLPKSTSQSVFPLSSCHWRDLQARWVWQDDPARRWGSRLTLGWFVSLRQVPCAHESHSHVMFVT